MNSPPSSDASDNSATAADVRLDPAYHGGFFDAQSGEPLFPDASTPYEAGWRAYWRARDLLQAAGFARRADGQFTKRTAISGPAAAGQTLAGQTEDPPHD